MYKLSSQRIPLLHFDGIICGMWENANIHELLKSYLVARGNCVFGHSILWLINPWKQDTINQMHSSLSTTADKKKNLNLFWTKWLIGREKLRPLNKNTFLILFILMKTKYTYIFTWEDKSSLTSSLSQTQIQVLKFQWFYSVLFLLFKYWRLPSYDHSDVQTVI